MKKIDLELLKLEISTKIIHEIAEFCYKLNSNKDLNPILEGQQLVLTLPGAIEKMLDEKLGAKK